MAEPIIVGGVRRFDLELTRLNKEKVAEPPPTPIPEVKHRTRNVLFAIDEELLVQIDEKVAELQTEYRRFVPTITKEQSSEARRITIRDGVEAANRYLREVQKRPPKPSRNELLNRIVRAGIDKVLK